MKQFLFYLASMYLLSYSAFTAGNQPPELEERLGSFGQIRTNYPKQFAKDSGNKNSDKFLGSVSAAGCALADAQKSYHNNNTFTHDPELSKESLLSLLVDLHDDSFSMLQARAERLLKNNPEWVVSQIESLLQSRSETNALIRLLDENDKSANILGDYIVKHFDCFTKAVQSSYFLSNLVHKKYYNKILVEQLALPLLPYVLKKPVSDDVIETIETVFLPHRDYGPRAIKELAKTQSRSQDTVVQELLRTAIVEQPQAFIEYCIAENRCRMNTDAFEYKGNWSKWSKSIALINKYVIENFDQIIQSPEGISIAVGLGTIRIGYSRKSIKILNMLENRISDVLDKLTPLTAYELGQRFGTNRELLNRINQRLAQATEQYVQTLTGSDQISDVEEIVCSPTVQHIIKSFSNFTLAHYMENSHLTSLAQRVIHKETELNSQGYFTFVHGQRWHYQLIEEWFTKLWQLTRSRDVQDYIFPHVKTISDDEDHEQQIRKKIMFKGRSGLQLEQGDDRQRLLFMNAGLFYNGCNVGSNTAYYIAKNMNINTHIQLSLHDVFKMHRLETVFNTYKNELQELQNEHAQLSTYGNLLLIAVPEKAINQAVFIAKPGGYKKNVRIKDVGQTDDVQLILNTLRTKPEKIEDFDCNEFCLVMTADKQGGLNPESGIKFFQFNTVDPERWKQFKEREQALFERIAQEITAQQPQQRN